jgi:hypothetical protein
MRIFGSPDRSPRALVLQADNRLSTVEADSVVATARLMIADTEHTYLNPVEAGSYCMYRDLEPELTDEDELYVCRVPFAERNTVYSFYVLLLVHDVFLLIGVLAE